MAVDYWPTLAPIAQNILNNMIPAAKDLLGLERAPELHGNYPRWSGKAQHRFQMLPVDGVRTGLINIDAEQRTSDSEMRENIAYFLPEAAVYQLHDGYEDRYRQGQAICHEFMVGVARFGQVVLLRAQSDSDSQCIAETIERRMERRFFRHPDARLYARVKRSVENGTSLREIIERFPIQI